MWGKYSYTSRLSPVALAVAFGVVSALWMAVFAWTAGFGHEASSMFRDLAAMYPGYDTSVKGGFIGAAWGFVEGFIFGLLVGWVYNMCMCCCKGCRRGPEDETKL